ncbi:MAG: hypothetical protein LBU89_05905 [Fibromonadaceae bacterium]|jgi:hypothetical protein|nr:hypothetical protein [Fibromonadaceae bacterium]
MRFFLKILPIALVLAFLVPASFANEGIYDRDLVRGFISLKGGFRSIKSNGIKFINEYTEKSYSKEHLGGHVEIGAEYHQLRTWFDVDFMPITPTRGNTEWFAYGITWMWGYKVLPQNSFVNIIPSIGPGVELMNLRESSRDRVVSSFGPTLNLELEFRLQFSQFSAGAYGGYKVIRHDGWSDESRPAAGDWPYGGDLNADKVFAGIKFSWTMLNNFQRREKDLL